MKSKIGVQLYKQKIRKNYGITCMMNRKDIKQKCIKTHIERYGCEYSSQNKECQEKRKQTLNNKYGGNYKKHLSKKCSEKHINNPTQRHIVITSDHHRYVVRSKLEMNILQLLSNITDFKYEPFIITTDKCTIIPDLLVGNKIIMEIKYYKYTIKQEPTNVHKRHKSMWESARLKIPELRKWCNENNYQFYIITERDIKIYENLDQLVTHLKQTRPNQPLFSHY
jgi:hypothetical protein